MLDHTVIVFLSDNGATHHSNAEHWPLLLLGGGAWDLTQAAHWSHRSLVIKTSAPKSGLQHAGARGRVQLDDWGESPIRQPCGPVARLR